MRYPLEVLRVMFPGGCYLCPKCLSPYATDEEWQACAASHPPDVPPTNEDR